MENVCRVNVDGQAGVCYMTFGVLGRAFDVPALPGGVPH